MAGPRFQVNKSHKSRFSSKASRNIHRTSQNDKGRISKPQAHPKGARAARLQRNKMVRDRKRAALLKEKRATGGSTNPPLVIVLFGLSASVDVSSLAKELIKLLSPEGATSTTVASPSYKLRTTVLEAPHGDIVSCMAMAKVADLIAFVASASSLCEESKSGCFLDSFGSQCLSVFRSLGLPSTSVLIRDIPEDSRTKNDLKKMCSSTLAPEFPEDCKFYPVDTKEELHKFVWLCKEQRLSVPRWRTLRPYLLAQEVNVVADDGNPGKSTLLLSGYVRGRNLSVNQLVHISGAGDFELSLIEVLKDPFPMNERKGQDLMDSDESSGVQIVRTFLPDPLRKEPLLVENIPDPLAGEQTWPTEAEIAEAETVNKTKTVRKRTLPCGTSEYQAAWIVDDTDGSDSDGDESNGMAVDEGHDSFANKANTRSDFDEDQVSVSFSVGNFDGGTEVDTEMTDGEELTKEQIEAEIRKIKDAHVEDEEFPDEVDTPLDVPARKRFAKYRALKSLRTSSWDPKESLPPDYARIFAFDKFSRTHKHVLAKALDLDRASMDDCALPGCYVRLHIKQVSVDVASKLVALSNAVPVLACGLLQHESKMSVLHFSIKKHDSYDAPLKSKEPLVFHVGFRQFIARPLYSSDNINSDKHKMERFLHAGRFSIASVYAPISFPPLPLIALKCGHGVANGPAIAAVGSLRSIDPDRLILKKIILTGYPQRVSKLKATVRYMFHSPEDVRWFKPVEVFTKCGRRGRVKEPVGTHGAMKCVFNGVVQQHDTVCMSLYKRVYPKWPEHLTPVDI